MDIKEIGKRIKESREEVGISAVELAEVTGLNKATIHRYEKGDIKNIKLPVIESIANKLNINPSWIIGKSENKFVDDTKIVVDKNKIRDIDRLFSYMTSLIKLEGILIEGEPADSESAQALIDAMEIGVAMAKKKAKEKQMDDEHN